MKSSTTALMVLGDICLAGDAESRLRSGGSGLFAGLPPSPGKARTLIGNLECALTRRGTPRPCKWANLRAAPEAGDLLGSLDVAILANNHISDFGEVGVADTIEALRQRSIVPVGYGADLAEAARPVMVPCGPIRLGLVALCCVTTNGENLATHLTPGVAPLAVSSLRQAIQAARAQADLVLTYLHWGREQDHDPVPEQVRLGRLAIEFGADAVVGTHGHVIQSYECYRGKWIFYGLGNYLFGNVPTQAPQPDGTIKTGLVVQQPPNRESLAVEFHVEQHAEGSRLVLHQVHCLQFNDHDYTPRPVPESQLTVDLPALNRRLETFTRRHELALQSRQEPVYAAAFRHGILAYDYASPSLPESGGRPWVNRLASQWSRISARSRQLFRKVGIA